ncbi:MAG: outer membrane protein transport protein [Muribaculaceae bacterium]|nr:outer membrane protein transport protein [Muribaculaceae bacterium]
MKKSIITISLGLMTGGAAFGQSAITAYDLAQPDMKGTARFMGMAGAFGALGGDLSTLSQNPAGIGVYRSSDIGFTLDLDMQRATSHNDGKQDGMDQTKFLLNNIGTVLTLRLNNDICPNLNFGFTYNKGASFNRVYGGDIRTLQNSMSNYIAGVANDPDGSGIPLSESEVASTDKYNPYNPAYGEYAPPWITILGYDSYLITPQALPDGSTEWKGLWSNNSMTGQNTNGSGLFAINEKGGINEFNIAIGGNINNVLYWGMNFDIINMNYSLNAYWGENLTNAYVPDANNQLTPMNANWGLTNLYSASGTGFNYQLGFILKPVQELRLGFAFHTPTWYNINENFSGTVNYKYNNTETGFATTNDGYAGYNSYGFRTPWKIIASAAGVLSQNLIVSFDYEWANYGSMKFSEPTYYGGYYDDYDPWWPYSEYSASTYSSFIDPNDPYAYENMDISNYYKSTNTFRVGVEFKPSNPISLRAGYSYVSSPVKASAKNNDQIIYTAGTNPSYRFDNATNYITAGIGYRYQRFYVDLAYVYKHMSSTYHAYTPDPANPRISSPQSKLDFSNNQVVLSAGFRF